MSVIESREFEPSCHSYVDVRNINEASIVIIHKSRGYIRERVLLSFFRSVIHRVSFSTEHWNMQV